MMSRDRLIRAAVVGHLTITVPVFAAIFLVTSFEMYMFGPTLIPYYVLTGIAIGWQWCSFALPRWKEWVAKTGASDEERGNLPTRIALIAPGHSVGLFALHTAAACWCAVHLSGWLVARWFGWILPLTGQSSTAVWTDFYLKHLEVATVIPAALVGYFVSRRFNGFGPWAWLLPTSILGYKLLTFTEPAASVFSSPSSSRFSYFFVVQPHWPTLFDPSLQRVVEQMFVVAPFYAGIAYSIGSIAAKYDLLTKIIDNINPSQAEDEAERQSVEDSTASDSGSTALLP